MVDPSLAVEADARPGLSLLYMVKQVELAVRGHLDELLKPAGVTALQYTALTVLDRRDGLTSAELARRSFVTPQSMTDMVKGLERRGLIDRRPDADHGRRLLISLTAEGRDLLRAYESRARALEDRMVTGFSAQERERLQDLLNRCRAALEPSPV